MQPTSKLIVWLHGEIKTPPFSSQARLETGLLLRLLQQGENLGLPHSRPMPIIGQNCHELRVPDEKHNWRIMYLLDSDTIVILEVFAKTTPKTPKRTLGICQRRLKLYIQTLEVNDAKDKT